MNARIIQIVHFGNEIFFLNDEDDDDERPKKVERMDDFVEIIVPNFADHQFKQHFRMNSTTFEDFLRKLHAVVPHDSTVGHPKLLLEKQAMICIWYLANLESFRSLADRFGITKSTAWDVLSRMGELIPEVNRVFRIISWPSHAKALGSINAFQNINGFPGVVGSIDGSHIRILPSRENPNSYVNRKKFHSILLQGVWDEEKRFIDVFSGLPGSCHDARLFAMSDLNLRINNNSIVPPRILYDWRFGLYFNKYTYGGLYRFRALNKSSKIF